MKRRFLGKNGPRLSEVALGCWQLGGTDFGDVPDETAHQILQAALERGIDFFDTADVYGGGRSERLIGEFLRNARAGDRVFVATKYGRGGGVYPDGYSEDSLRRAIDEARERLGVARLGLLQLHCVPTQVLRDGAIFDWLRGAQERGMIQYFGASVETMEEGHICIGHGVQSLQVIYNLFRQRLAYELLPQACAAGVGIIVRLPLASGLLSGKFTRDSTFAENDHRNFNRDGQRFSVGETFSGLGLEKGVELADGLKGMVPEGMTMAQMSQRWILDHFAVTSVITGATRPEQVRENAGVSGLAPLNIPLHGQLRSYYEENVEQHLRGPY